jgi:hypothetical protein
MSCSSTSAALTFSISSASWPCLLDLDLGVERVLLRLPHPLLQLGCLLLHRGGGGGTAGLVDPGRRVYVAAALDRLLHVLDEHLTLAV